MIRLLLALPLVLGFAQDDAIHALIKRLDDPDLAVREKAVNDLIKVGAKALEPLRKAQQSDSAEVRARAGQAIREIELVLKSREVYPEFKPLGLKRTGTVGEIVGELTRLSGAKVEASEELRALKGSVDASTLLQALEQLCAAQSSMTYSMGDDGNFRLLSEPHVRKPASFFESFKVHVHETQALRKSDFKETTVAARLSLHTTWESRLKPLKRVRYEFESATDDAGRAVELVPASPENFLRMGGGGVFFAGGFGEDPDSGGPQDFDLKGLAPDAKSMAVVKGRAFVSFPLLRGDVTFEDPQARASHAAGDVAIRIKQVSTKKGTIKLSFTKSKGEVVALRDEIMGRVDPATIRAVDEDGKEHVGELGPDQAEGAPGMVVIGGGPGGEQNRTLMLQASFPTLEGRDIKKFTFKFADAMFEKSVPFEIKDIKLP